jgi:hypothetical protein
MAELIAEENKTMMMDPSLMDDFKQVIFCWPLFFGGCGVYCLEHLESPQ